MKPKIVTIIVLIFIFPVSLHTHGVRGKVGKGRIVVIAQYDTGEPMSYAKVEISAPNSKLPFQSGRINRNGRFCFFPDTPGTWKVVVNEIHQSHHGYLYHLRLLRVPFRMVGV